jgi:hypothetical protein
MRSVRLYGPNDRFQGKPVLLGQLLGFLPKEAPSSPDGEVLKKPPPVYRGRCYSCSLEFGQLVEGQNSLHLLHIALPSEESLDALQRKGSQGGLLSQPPHQGLLLGAELFF